MEKLFPGCESACEGYKTAMQLIEKAAASTNAVTAFKAEAGRLQQIARKLDQEGYPVNAARVSGMSEAYKKCAMMLSTL